MKTFNQNTQENLKLNKKLAIQLSYCLLEMSEATPMKSH